MPNLDAASPVSETMLCGSARRLKWQHVEMPDRDSAAGPETHGGTPFDYGLLGTCNRNERPSCQEHQST
jgi:hypothetical protein